MLLFLSMKNIFDITAEDFLSTKFGTFLISAVGLVFVISSLALVFGMPYLFFDLFWTVSSIVSFFLLIVLLMLRFEPVAQKLMDVFVVILNVASWVWLVYAFFINPVPGNDAVVFIFILVQVFTARRVFNAIASLLLK